VAVEIHLPDATNAISIENQVIAHDGEAVWLCLRDEHAIKSLAAGCSTKSKTDGQ
jgi:hypothetical protein